MNRYKLNKNMLEIELTESSLIHNKNIVINALNQFRDLGVRTAIDDFGTGYSSLSYLACMPFDLIKIDKSFIDNLGKILLNTKVFMSIIQMGKRLGMEVLAEGVETKLQHQIISRNKCDLMQGYLIGKPVKQEKIPGLINNNLQIVTSGQGKVHGI